VNIGHWSAFVRFHYRVTIGMNIVLFLGLLALVCLGAFSWAVGKKPNTPAPPTFVLLPGISQSSASTTEGLPRLPPVHFQTGSSALTKEGYEVVNRARNLLKENGAASLLVYGYTDTRGGRRLNETLAVRRIESVINVLAQEGGIARSRMLAVPLPKSDLPTVTEQDTDEQNNRSVHLVLVRLP
jgi:outer membrane protein OmpA-like peptidoglycan-associated protein